MHELSLAQGIVDIVQQYVPNHQAAMVTTVRVRVGQLSGVVPESLSFCFEAIVAGTPLQAARLDIERVATGCECRDCGHQFDAADLSFACPACGGNDVRIFRGRDLQVVHLELAEEPVPGP